MGARRRFAVMPLFAAIKSVLTLVLSTQLIAEPWDIGEGGLSGRGIFRHRLPSGTTIFAMRARRFWLPRNLTTEFACRSRRFQRCV